MVDIEFKLSGDMESGLDRLEARIKGDVLLSGVAAMALVVYDELKLQTSPPKIGRVTGNLNDAVYRFYAKDASDADTKRYYVGFRQSQAPHWHLLEYGTYRMTARAPLRKSFDRMQEAIQSGNSRMAERMAEGTDAIAAGIDLT